MPARYAIYYVPEPGTALALRVSALLGRDAETGAPLKRPPLPGLGARRLSVLTTTARRYGAHATLKAPFFLDRGAHEEDLLEAADRFSREMPPVVLPRLELARIGAFFALVPAAKNAAERGALKSLGTLAADAVTFFDVFRAAPRPEETAKRRPEKLTPRQKELLERWGYPYVFEEYRFHLTLTDRVRDAEEASALHEALETWLEPVLRKPAVISGICVCKQELAGKNLEAGAFHLLRRAEARLGAPKDELFGAAAPNPDWRGDD